MIDEVEVVADRVEEGGVPGIVVAAGDELSLGIDVAEHRGVAAILVGVDRCVHVAATAPVLVADTPEADVEGLGRTVRGTLAAKAGVDGRIAVLDPVAEFLWGAAANVAGEVGLGAKHGAETEEFLGAETVGILDLEAARHAEAGRTRRGGADAVAPVVVVGVASAGPAEHGDREGLEGFDDVGAEAIEVGNIGLIRPDPEAVVAAASEVFGEVAVEPGRDCPDRFALANRQRRE